MDDSAISTNQRFEAEAGEAGKFEFFILDIQPFLTVIAIRNSKGHLA